MSRSCLYRLALVTVLALPPVLAGCGGDCEDRLEIELPAGREGLHAFEGTADGEAFECTYHVSILGGEMVTVSQPACSGPARLRVQSRHWEEMDIYSDWVYAAVDGGPAVVDWTLTQPDTMNPDSPLVNSGRLAPEYRNADGCRRAEVELW
jgi:hypothetical protein